MKKKIIFVEDNPNDLGTLRRKLRGAHGDWEPSFALGGHAALDRLREETYHVLVTETRLTGMDGCELLSRVKDLYPRVVRIVFSEQSDRAMFLKSTGLAHQCIGKPCDPQALKASVDRACAVHGLLEDEALANIVSGMGSLPSLPSLYTDVLREAGSPACSLDRIAEVISQDVGMSAKILQLANSAFFGHPQRVTSIVKAVLFLGLETIKALILSVKIFSRFDHADFPGFSIAGLWNHSISTALRARSMATQRDLAQSTIDEAFMAGLLHDAGKLILADRLPERYSGIVAAQGRGHRLLCEAEQESLGTTHAQVGAYLMGIWGLSEPIVEAIAYHHSPSRCPSQSFNVLTAVHLANSLDHTDGIEADRLDHAYLGRLGVEAGLDRPKKWADG